MPSGLPEWFLDLPCVYLCVRVPVCDWMLCLCALEWPHAVDKTLLFTSVFLPESKVSHLLLFSLPLVGGRVTKPYFFHKPSYIRLPPILLYPSSWSGVSSKSLPSIFSPSYKRRGVKGVALPKIGCSLADGLRAEEVGTASMCTWPITTRTPATIQSMLSYTNNL